MSIIKYSLVLIFCVFAKLSTAQNPDTVRLFLIGNSFSQNATTFLPQLAKAEGKVLIIGRAELAASSLKKHWDNAEMASSDTSDVKGKPYGGKSLQQLLEEQPWDIVSLQQYSYLSSDYSTYEPYLSKIAALVKSIQPTAKLVIHETWAYRADDTKFSRLTKDVSASSAKMMFEGISKAYKQASQLLKAELVPTGSAFEKVSLSQQWGYIADKQFNYEKPTYPTLPNQQHSLHRGYYWAKDKLKYDSHHASVAVCYLGSLVWYDFLFGVPANMDGLFVPKTLDRPFASYLQKVAAATVENNKAQN